MSDLMKAMEMEREYLAFRMKGEEPWHLADRVKEFGFADLAEYFNAKRDHLFNLWVPDVYYIDIETFAADVEDAIQNGKHGIYIPQADGLYAYHGTDTIDYDLCERLGVRVVELNYDGGTIVGSAEDLSIEIVMPASIDLTHSIIINKFREIIAKYVPGVTVNGNDILVDGEKVSGSMMRFVGDTAVWAAQISFGEYSEVIAQVCNKVSVKKPAHIDKALLGRDQLENEVVAWLRKR